MSEPEERFLVYAPKGRDGVLICEAMERAGFAAECCISESRFLQAIQEPFGGILLTEEGAVRAVASALSEAVAQQPPWSDVPILLLTSSSRSPSAPTAHLLKLAGERGNITLLERPLRVDTLLSSVKAASRARRRQYEIRNHLTERQKHEEKMRETAKLESIGVLAGGIAHDFNNLLTGVIGNASLCLEMSPGAEMEERLVEVLSAGERAAELTRQLLAYAGKGRFVIGPIDLSALAAEIAPLVKRFIPAMAALTMNSCPDLPFMEGDYGQLQQVVMNLIINAAESIPEGQPGTIIITTGLRNLGPDDSDRAFALFDAPPGSYVYLDVSDTGMGMTEEVRARIFDPFFTTKFQGRGLGLAAVLGIVRSHKGAMRVTSRLGEGTSFTVFFPASSTVPRQEKADHAQCPTLRPATVLFVDDDAGVRSVAVNSLEKRGVTVHLAGSGQDAVRLFQEFERDISVVVLDLSMPGMGSEESLALIRRIRPDVRVVLSSGFSELVLEERFAGKALDGFLQKPYTSSQLIEKIGSVLAAR